MPKDNRLVFGSNIEHEIRRICHSATIQSCFQGENNCDIMAKLWIFLQSHETYDYFLWQFMDNHKHKKTEKRNTTKPTATASGTGTGPYPLINE